MVEWTVICILVFSIFLLKKENIEDINIRNRIFNYFFFKKDFKFIDNVLKLSY